MKITIYTMSNCSPCNQLKQWFLNKNIEFIEKDILKNTNFFKEFTEKNLKFTPYTILETNEEEIEIIGANINMFEKFFSQTSSLK